jgi:site-specific DNA recombinase
VATASYWNGRACSNGVAVRRDALESVILTPIYEELLEPKRIAAMVKKMEQEHTRRMQQRKEQVTDLPPELQELDDRITRLRTRLQTGDPGMSGADIQAAIKRAEGKRQELAKANPENKQHAKVLALLPKAAATYRRQLKEGLDGNVRAATGLL